MNSRDREALLRAVDRYAAGKRAALIRYAADLAQIRERGHSLEDIAEVLGVTKQAISDIQRRARAADTPPPIRT